MNSVNWLQLTCIARSCSIFPHWHVQGPTPILEEPTTTTKAATDTSAHLNELSLGSNPMYPGLFFDARNPNFRPYIPVFPPTSMAVMTLGATEQIPETSAVNFSGDGARPVLPRPLTIPASGPMAIPYPIPLWLPRGFNRPASSADSKVLRPTAKLSTEPLNVGVLETKEMSQLNLGLSAPEPSQLTLKLLDQPSRSSSAFHVSTSSISSSNNAIGVVWCDSRNNKLRSFDWFDAELELSCVEWEV